MTIVIIRITTIMIIASSMLLYLNSIILIRLQIDPSYDWLS